MSSNNAPIDRNSPIPFLFPTSRPSAKSIAVGVLRGINFWINSEITARTNDEYQDGRIVCLPCTFIIVMRWRDTHPEQFTLWYLCDNPDRTLAEQANDFSSSPENAGFENDFWYINGIHPDDQVHMQYSLGILERQLRGAGLFKWTTTPHFSMWDRRGPNDESFQWTYIS
ncbi:hypothetical protein H4R33_000163 [Dimargaris cristalligena]|uniref:Uncharacterized protein n=1 Tax=Dimargaris cristalligena TaxID=215637 RepID=A0A4P9ZP92_9FUNG|nr:hypothetical protein H4R33_000163 [Dimargaris cristalligena]RKP35254.1 hypothetical protein BJ085DRAFT_28119 [Dimargaris cristalligena]|eukprot:RKP35254.1 hypothetical protein BJ085DRAFT_28119 [Dimargaris cristalligena]